MEQSRNIEMRGWSVEDVMSTGTAEMKTHGAGASSRPCICSSNHRTRPATTSRSTEASDGGSPAAVVALCPCCALHHQLILCIPILVIHLTIMLSGHLHVGIQHQHAKQDVPHPAVVDGCASVAMRAAGATWLLSGATGHSSFLHCAAVAQLARRHSCATSRNADVAITTAHE